MSKDELDALLLDDNSSRNNPNKAKNHSFKNALKRIEKFESQIRRASMIDIVELMRIRFR